MAGERSKLGQFNADRPLNSFGNSPFTEAEKLRMSELLSRKLNESEVSNRVGAGGKKLSYIEGWRAFEMANDIFGPSGWSTTIISVTDDFMEEKNGSFTVGISALVRVTLQDGCFHEDIGYGVADNIRGQGAALEKAKKEAITDATKRALRLFGNALGNSVYDKEHCADVERRKVTANANQKASAKVQNPVNTNTGAHSTRGVPSVTATSTSPSSIASLSNSPSLSNHSSAVSSVSSVSSSISCPPPSSTVSSPASVFIAPVSNPTPALNSVSSSTKVSDSTFPRGASIQPKQPSPPSCFHQSLEPVTANQLPSGQYSSPVAFPAAQSPSLVRSAPVPQNLLTNTLMAVSHSVATTPNRSTVPNPPISRSIAVVPVLSNAIPAPHISNRLPQPTASHLHTSPLRSAHPFQSPKPQQSLQSLQASIASNVLTDEELMHAYDQSRVDDSREDDIIQVKKRKTMDNGLM